MEYLLMIYTDEAVEEAMTPEEMGTLMANYGSFTTELEASGAMRGGNRLRPIAAATSVSHKDGEFIVTDGPFAETKEQLGGYYLIEAESLDEALTWAKKLPSVHHGTVEVRPIWTMDRE